MRRAILVALLLVMAACGRKGELKPVAGDRPPPAPVWTATGPTPEEMLVPPPEAAPDRVDDVIRRPERERVDDPFDPPPRG